MSKNPDQTPPGFTDPEKLITRESAPLNESGAESPIDFDAQGNKIEQAAADLNAAESQVAEDAGELSEKNENADSQSIEKGENTSGENFNYQNSQAGTGEAKGKVKGQSNKQKIATMLILAMLGVGGMGVGMFGPQMMLFKFENVLTNKFNYQLASMENSTSKMWHYKIFGGNRACSGASCKFKGVSDAQLKKFDKAGIGYSLEKVGTKNYINELKVPDSSGRLDSSGNVRVTTLKADNFSSKMSTDPRLRAQVHKVYKPKYEGFVGKTWNNIKSKFGISKSVTIEQDIEISKATDTSTKSISQRFRDMESNTKLKLANNITEKLMKLRFFQNIDAMAKARVKNGIGDTAGDVASDTFSLSAISDLKEYAEKVCVVYNTLKISMYTVKAAQVATMIPEFMKTMSTISKIKSGEGPNSEEAEALGTLLTKTVRYGVEDGKSRLTLSAMDSFGYKYAAYGDLSIPSNDNVASDIDKTIKDNMRHWMTGGDFLGYLTKDFKILGIPVGGGLNYLSLIASSTVTLADSIARSLVSAITFGGVDNRSSLTQICRAVRSTEADFAVFGASVAELLGECVATVLIGCVVENIIDLLVGLGLGVSKAIAFSLMRQSLYGFINNFVQKGTGELITNSFGDDRGNMLASSAGLFMGQMASSGGNGLLTKNEALAYTREMNEVNLAYAEEDRVMRSPLDISSPNTLMGAIAYEILPRFASVDGVFSLMSSISSILSSGFLTPFKLAHADASATTQFEFCNAQDDVFLSKLGSDIAIDPFCNPVFGLTQGQTKNYDPDRVITDMINGDHIDDNGEPKSKIFEEFIKDCAANRMHLFGWDGDVDDEKDDVNPGANCAVGQSYKGINNTLFYSYLQYQRVSDGMDV